jgi:quercetin 2,3-dioxygenase
MITLRPSNARGHANHGWLDSHHTFSFADYYDAQHMGFRALRVINEDRVAPSRGFGTHPHRDMEIISYVIEGQLAHHDSMGTGSVIVPGDVQRMSAGSGVTHSEKNPSSGEGVHFLQIWIMPSQRGLTPSYAQKHFSREDKLGRLREVASPDGRDGSITIHSDVRLFASVLERGQRIEHALATSRHAWIQVVAGAVRVSGEALSAGDGAAVSDEHNVVIECASDEAEVLLFDLE